MRTRRTLASTALALSLTGALLGAACSSEGTAGPPTSAPTGGGDTTGTAGGGDTPVRDIGVDPEDFIEDYESPALEDDASMGYATSSGPATTVPASTVPATSGTVAPVPGPYDDNTFVDPGHQAAVATADDATATFGLDVDTGSATVARQWISSGTRPDPASVRTEEWVNSLTYGGEAPDDGLAVTIDGAPSSFAPDHHVVRVGVQAAETVGQRRPANIVVVVDTSGSMDIADRLGTVQASLALLAQHLPDGDTLGIVTYSDDAEVILEPTPVEDTDTIVDAIESLTPDGSTNMEAGITAGYELAAEHFRADGINRVVLASDGVANQGLVDPAALAEMVQDRAGDGIQLVTVGYGMGNFNDHLMEQLADDGDGMYAYVDRYEEAEELFATRLNATIEPVALDAKAQVVFDPALVTEWRLLGYENRALTDDEYEATDTDAGEVGAGHDVTAVFEVVLADGALGAGTPLATAELRWETPGSGAAQVATAALGGDDVAGSWDEAAPALRAAVAAAAGAEVLAGAPEATQRGTTLDAVADELDRAADEVEDPLATEARELADLLRTAADLPASPTGSVPPGQ